jgi:hypothetical protein
VTASARNYAKFCARRFIERLIETGADGPSDTLSAKGTANLQRRVSHPQ